MKALNDPTAIGVANNGNTRQFALNSASSFSTVGRRLKTGETADGLFIYRYAQCIS
jgi:hypothetical protein